MNDDTTYSTYNTSGIKNLEKTIFYYFFSLLFRFFFTLLRFVEESGDGQDISFHLQCFSSCSEAAIFDGNKNLVQRDNEIRAKLRQIEHIIHCFGLLEISFTSFSGLKTTTLNPSCKMGDFSGSSRAVKVTILCMLWYILSSSNNVIIKRLVGRYPYPTTVTLSHLTWAAFLIHPILLCFGVRTTLDIPMVRFYVLLIPLGVGKLLVSVSSHVSIWRIPVSYAHTGELKNEQFSFTKTGHVQQIITEILGCVSTS